MAPSLSELELDALRELINVGAGHAARALSRLLKGERFGLWPPLARVLGREQLAALLGAEDLALTAISLEVRGDSDGSLWVVFTAAHAAKLAALLLPGKGGEALSSTDGALLEAANIVASACAGAMGEMTGLLLVPSVPTLVRGTCAGVAERICQRETLALEAELFATPLSARVVFLPDASGLSRLLAALRI